MEEVGEGRGSLDLPTSCVAKAYCSESKNDCDIQNYDSEECELQDHMYMLNLFHAKTIPSHLQTGLWESFVQEEGEGGGGIEHSNHLLFSLVCFLSKWQNPMAMYNLS